MSLLWIALLYHAVSCEHVRNSKQPNDRPFFF